MADAAVSSGEEEDAEDDAAMDAEEEQWLTEAIEMDAAEDSSEEEDAKGPSKAPEAAAQERPAEAQAAGSGQLVAWEEPSTTQPSSLAPPLLPLVASPSNSGLLSPLSPAESTLPPTPRPPPAALQPASPRAGVPRALSPLRGAGPLVVAEAAGAPAPPAPAATEQQKAQEEARAGTRGSLKWKLEQARMVFKLGIPVDVAALGRALPSSELVGKGFLLRVRKQRPPTWNAIVSCTGTVRFSTKLTGDEGRTAAKRFARLVQKRYSASAGFKHFRFMHAQVGARLGFAVNVERMSQSLPAGCRLVDLSPTHAAVQVPTLERKVTVYVWNTGKIKTFASETVEEALAAMDVLVPAARQHCMWW